MNYTKPPLSIPDQIKKLKSRGLQLNDIPKASHYLSNISYYRLRAYTYPFQDNTNEDHPFNQPVSFEDIIELYVFDRRLRLLIFNAIEKIEISLRTKIIYEFSLAHGSHWYENEDLFRNPDRFLNDMNSLCEEIDRSDETFIEHYKNKYSQPSNPPAWMSLEVASMGTLSKLFSNLKKNSEKKQVTQSFGLKQPEILESWMHSFSGLRNVCAHHGRVWNRRFTIQPTIPYNTVYSFLNNIDIFPNKLYAMLSCMTYILDIISPGNSFNTRLMELIKSCTLIDLREMGFPKDWEKEEIWQ